jgi:hypothetical protein
MISLLIMIQQLQMTQQINLIKHSLAMRRVEEVLYPWPGLLCPASGVVLIDTVHTSNTLQPLDGMGLALEVEVDECAGGCGARRDGDCQPPSAPPSSNRFKHSYGLGIRLSKWQELVFLFESGSVFHLARHRLSVPPQCSTWLSGSVFHLARHKVSVWASGGEEAVVCALFHDSTATEDDNTVRILDGRQPVRHHHHCPPCHERVQRCLHRLRHHPTAL